MKWLVRSVVVVLGACTAISSAQSGFANELKITLLGTGTPSPSAERFGAAILVEANGKKFLFDCGRGSVIRLTQAGAALTDIDAVFLTHLHSDHIVGIPDLWLSGWLLGRSKPFRLVGPEGTRAFAPGLLQAFDFDIRIRQLLPQSLTPKRAEIDAKEISEGGEYVDGPIRISAFLVDHGPVKPAIG